MPLEIQSSSAVQDYHTSHKDDECPETIFKSKEHMKQSLSRLCYGNLQVIGSIWIAALRKVLTGTKMCLIPTVHAAKKEEVPSKPPKMKYKDLPLYAQPHREYKDYIEEKTKDRCPRVNDKILHEAVFPYASTFRRHAAYRLCVVQNLIIDTCKNTYEAFEAKKKQIKADARDPKNECYRKMAVYAGAATGLILGRRKGLARTLFYMTIGTLATGWLCYPKETDREFRKALTEITYYTIVLCNLYCRDRIPYPVFGPCEAHKPKIDESKKKEPPCKIETKK